MHRYPAAAEVTVTVATPAAAARARRRRIIARTLAAVLFLAAILAPTPVRNLSPWTRGSDSASTDRATFQLDGQQSRTGAGVTH